MIHRSRPAGPAVGAMLAAALFALPAHAASDGAPPRLITMTGTGEVHAVPDQARLSAGVVSEAKTAAAAFADNNHMMRAVLAALKQLGVPEKRIQTSGFSVSPQYPPYNSKQPRHIIGYQVSNSVRVKLDDMKTLGPALDALVSAGANQINSVSFAIANPTPLLAKAREAAVKDATEKAETYAHAAHVSLGAVQSIREGSNNRPSPTNSIMALRAAPEAVPVAAGEQTVSANVTITWQIH